MPCNSSHNCMCCDMIMDSDNLNINGRRVKTAHGNCGTYNIVYLVQCSVCKMAYVGRTIKPLRTRISQHHAKFYDLVGGKPFDSSNDEFSLALQNETTLLMKQLYLSSALQ